MSLIEQTAQTAVYSKVVDDMMYIVHDDGAVSLIESARGGAIAVEALTAESVLRVVAHARPFVGVARLSLMNWRARYGGYGPDRPMTARRRLRVCTRDRATGQLAAPVNSSDILCGIG